MMAEAEAPEAKLARAVRAAGIEVEPRYEAETPSTNLSALGLAEAGAPEWTLVAAGHQTAGRGRLGRRWTDRPGTALMFSIVLRPAVEASRWGLLPLLAGSSMARAARAAAAGDVACKWPNDLLLADRKVGGVLAEARTSAGRLDHVVLGVGVNLGEPPDVPGAGALEGPDRWTLLERFLTEFREAYRPGEPGFATAVVERSRPLLVTLGRRVRARTTGGELIDGLAKDLDEAGGLLVEVGGGLRTVAFGEVEHLDADG